MSSDTQSKEYIKSLVEMNTNPFDYSRYSKYITPIDRTYDNSTRGPSSWNMYRMITYGIDREVAMWYWVSMPINVRIYYDTMAVLEKKKMLQCYNYHSNFDFNYEGDDYMNFSEYNIDNLSQLSKWSSYYINSGNMVTRKKKRKINH